MFPPPKVHKWLCFSIAFLLMAFCTQAQQVRRFTWDDVQSLPLLKETRFITGGYTSDRLLLIRDQPLAIWRKVDSVNTVPEIPVLPPGERLYKAAVHNGVLFFMTIGTKPPNHFRLPVHIYVSETGVADAVKTFTTEPILPDYENIELIPSTGVDCKLWPTEDPQILFLVLEEIPTVNHDVFNQKLSTYITTQKGKKWTKLHDLNTGYSSPYHYKYSKNYFIGTFSSENYNYIFYGKSTNFLNQTLDTFMVAKELKDPFDDHFNIEKSWKDIIVYKDTLYCFEANNTSMVKKFDLKNHKALPTVTYPIADVNWVKYEGNYYYLFSPSEGLFRATTPIDAPQKIYPILPNDVALINRVSFLDNNRIMLSTFNNGLVYQEIGRPPISWEQSLGRVIPENISPAPMSAIVKFNDLHFALKDASDPIPLTYSEIDHGLKSIFLRTPESAYLYRWLNGLNYIYHWNGNTIQSCIDSNFNHFSISIIKNTEKLSFLTSSIFDRRVINFSSECDYSTGKDIIDFRPNILLFNDYWKFGMYYTYHNASGRIIDYSLLLYNSAKQGSQRRKFPVLLKFTDFLLNGRQISLYKKDLVICTDTTCYETNDGALNWRKVPDPLSNVIRVFAFQDSLLFSFAPGNQSFYLSADWGANWVQIDNYVPAHVNAFALSGNQAYWFTSDSLYTADATRLLKLVNDIKVSNKTTPPLAELQPYPNPVVAGQEIRFPGNTPIRSCRLFSLTGQIIQQLTEMDYLSIHAPGYYLLEWVDANGEKTLSKIVVIKSTN